MSEVLQSLKYERGSLVVLDQLLLPHQLEYTPIQGSKDAWRVIKSMQVRGAPLIAIVAALGLAIEAYQKLYTFSNKDEAKDFLLEELLYLRTSRPTAVNLFQATDVLKTLVEELYADANASPTSILTGYIDAAEEMLTADVASNVAIGNFGAAKILEMTGKSSVKVVTICNTGSLATAGYGTALGVVRSLHSMGKLEHIYACETRPYNQGARLTAFEIVQDNLPGTLITDSMASYLMATKGADCVVVGADRVAANGDTANKIGTYQLAIAAQYHGIPFFVAAPTTTLDPATSDGSKIHIEERPENELTTIFGQKIAPDGIKAWNPAFDVTSSSLIAGIITERGVIGRSTRYEGGKVINYIDVAGFLKNEQNQITIPATVLPATSTDDDAAYVPAGFRRLDEEALKDYILALPKVSSLLGVDPNSSADGLSIREVGDGNINFVYIISSKLDPSKCIVIKQALPYVRCVGESWPLTLERATFEMKALVAHGELCPHLVPKVFHFDETFALMIMQFIPPPHVILRRALIAKEKIACFQDIAYYMAHTLTGTSTLALDGPAFRTLVSTWSRNTSMCAVTEQVIFSDPYIQAPLNRHNSPHLDAIVAYIKTDCELLIAASNLKGKFLGSTQALIHGDLHSGSIMVKEGSTFVIDPEFAFLGPMGFDLGALLSNLLFSYFSQEPAGGFDNKVESKESDYASWVAAQIIVWYSFFEAEFTTCWEKLAASGKGTFFTGGVNASAVTLAIARKNFLADLWSDTIGFAGMKMIRRIVGVSHVADLEEIPDAFHRSICEKKCLLLARILVQSSQDKAVGQLGDVQKLVSLAKKVFGLSAASLEDMSDWRLKWKVLY